MHDLIPFLLKYWYLSGAFIILFVLLIIEEARSKGLMLQVEPQAAVELINHEQAAVIDLRDRQAFKNGHIIDAINLPLVELEKSLNKLEKHKDNPIILVCEKGIQSGTMATKLRKQNFTRAVALSGGLSAWEQAQMPVVKGEIKQNKKGVINNDTTK